MTENIQKKLEADGDMDYDYANDILFFKVKGREYDYSLEFQNMIIDIDEEQFIIGIQIFNASKFLRINKINLRKITNWKFQAWLNGGEFRIDLNYQVIIRNKIIKNNIYPIIVQKDSGNLPNQQIVMTA